MKINYVIAAWSGFRRGGGEGKDFLQKQLLQLELVHHNLTQITVVVPFNPVEPPEFTEYLHKLRKSPLPIVLVRRLENVGVSYGCWSYIYDMYRTEFDYYIFMEDDYYFVQDNFDETLVKLLEGHGFVCGFVSKASGREWPGNANGIAKTEALEAIKLKYGRLPYDTQACGGGYTKESGQITWGTAFQDCGYSIGDITRKYAVLHWYWQRRKCELIPGQPVRDRFLFVPAQAPINYPFIPFKNRHQGAEGILFASGPTLNQYDYLEDDGKRIRVGVNSLITEPGKLDYYFCGHMDSRSLPYLPKIREFTGIKFGFTRVDRAITRWWLSDRQALDMNALPFEMTKQFHFCEDIAANPMINHAINFSALQFMVYTGMKKIHLVGCDVTSVVSNKNPSIDHLRHIGAMMKAWTEFEKFVKGRAEVASINPVALKGLFPARYTTPQE